MARKRNKYTEEFKRDAVRLMQNRGERTVAQVADDLGVPANQLHRWAAKLEAKDVAKRNDRGETLEDECVFRSIRSPVPGGSDHRSDDPIRDRSGATSNGGRSGGGVGLGVRFEAFLVADGGAAKREHVSVVHEPIADGVGDSRLAESLVPSFRRQL